MGERDIFKKYLCFRKFAIAFMEETKNDDMCPVKTSKEFYDIYKAI